MWVRSFRLGGVMLGISVLVKALNVTVNRLMFKRRVRVEG